MRPFAALALSLSVLLVPAQAGAAGAEPSPVDTWLTVPETVFDAEGLSLDAFKWRARPLIVFADSEFDPAFQEQMDLLAAETGALVERDVVIIVDTDPDARSEIRRELRPRGFVLVLIDKEGRINLRKPFPWDIREITHAIDKWPMRQQELREAERTGG